MIHTTTIYSYTCEKGKRKKNNINDERMYIWTCNVYSIADWCILMCCAVFLSLSFSLPSYYPMCNAKCFLPNNFFFLSINLRIVFFSCATLVPFSVHSLILISNNRIVLDERVKRGKKKNQELTTKMKKSKKNIASQFFLSIQFLSAIWPARTRMSPYSFIEIIIIILWLQPLQHWGHSETRDM